MNTTKKFISLFLSILMLAGCICIPVSAAQPEIMPYYNNVLNTASDFDIDSTGLATVTASYKGYAGVTSNVTITIKIQKKTLGLVWTKVDIGTTNNEIVVSSSNYLDEFNYDIQLNSTGNYRAVITYTVSGSGGADDEIEDICTYTYS